jgi:hypothetical protein
MKKIIKLFLLTPLLLLFLYTPAKAASIPPTVECQTFFKQEVKKINWFKQNADAKFFGALVDQGCLSSNRKQVVFKPRSALCLETANDLNNVFQPLSSAIRSDFKIYLLQNEIAEQVARKLFTKINQLDHFKVDGNKKAVKRVQKQIKQIQKEYRHKDAARKETFKTISSVLKPEAVNVVLALEESVSRGCIRLKVIEGSKVQPKGATERLIDSRLNDFILSGSYFYALV